VESRLICQISGIFFDRELFWFIGQYADGLIELGDNLIDPRIRLLHNERCEVLGLALLHLGGLQYIVVAAGVGVEPANEQAATEGLTAVARLADVEQYVGVGGKYVSGRVDSSIRC